MLKINYEFRKGLLFIRLKGVLNRETSKELSSSLDELINNKGVKFFVINLEKLDYLDDNGLSMLKEKYKDVTTHDGKLIICYKQNDIIGSMVGNEIRGAYTSSDELAAFNLIQI